MTLRKVLFRVKPQTDPVADPAATALALQGAAPGNAAYGQGGHPGTGVVIWNAGQTGIDHIANARHGQGCFGDVGGHDDFPAPVLFKDAFLPVGRQLREKRQDRQGRVPPAGERATGLADVLGRGHENKHIARFPPGQDIVHRRHRLFHIAPRAVLTAVP